MQIQVHYDGLDSSPWMDSLIKNKVGKLHRYLKSSATVSINLKAENRKYITSLAIHNFSRDYAFSAEGENLYESFSLAIDKASRSLGEQKRKMKDKINKKYIPLKTAIAS